MNLAAWFWIVFAPGTAQSLPPYIGQNGVSNAASRIPLSLPGGCLSAGVRARVDGLRLREASVEWTQNNTTRLLAVLSAKEEELWFVVPNDAQIGTAELVVASPAGRSSRTLLRVGPGCLGLEAEVKAGRTALRAEGAAASVVVNGVRQAFHQGMLLPAGTSGAAYLISTTGQMSNTIRVGKSARLPGWMEQLLAERGKIEIQVEASERRSGIGITERPRPARKIIRKLTMQQQEQEKEYRAQIPDLGQCTSSYSHAQRPNPIQLRDLENWVIRLEGKDWAMLEGASQSAGANPQAEMQEVKYIRRGQPLELRWRPVAGEAWLLLQNTDPLSTAAAMTFCRADAGSGRFLLSGQGTQNFPASSADGPPLALAALVLVSGERSIGAGGMSIYHLKSGAHVWHVRFD